MRVEHQLRAFNDILKSYDFSIPLHRFLPTYFKKHKNMGSSDRRWASRYVYSYLRMGNALKSASTEERLAIGDFLCNNTPSLVVQDKLPTISELQIKTVEEKLQVILEIYPDFTLKDVFRWLSELSEKIEIQEFLVSHLVQPDLFIAVEASKVTQFKNIFEEKGTHYQLIENTIFRLPNATKLDQIVSPSFGYRVQDLSSQKTAAFFLPKEYDYWWDCCAASGGKSLILHSLMPSVQLLVSDTRESVLFNLAERFKAAGITKYQSKVLNLTLNNDAYLHHYEFDGVILDAPCTGSGTWGRTPEMLSSFDASKIAYFSNLQKSIAKNVIKYLKVGKPLVYITCSVFKQENEDVVQYLLDNYPLELERIENIKGYTEKADTMFAARLIKK